MRRHIPGLHSVGNDSTVDLEGLFLVRIESAVYRPHSPKPFLDLRFMILKPKPFESRLFSGRLYCTVRALWKFNWFLTDFGYDPELLLRDQIDEKALLKLCGIVRTSHAIVNGRSYQNLDAFAPAAEWEPCRDELASDREASEDSNGL